MLKSNNLKKITAPLLKQVLEGKDLGVPWGKAQLNKAIL